MSKIIHIKAKESLRINSLEPGKVHRFHIYLSDNSLGVPWRVPLIVIKGANPGPSLGITAALHGNELNGISTIFKLIKKVKPETMSGNLIMCPISNIPGYLQGQRYFNDKVDLNRIMPGNPKSSSSAMYAHQFVNKIINKFDYLLDLHTASFGRVNSLYIRADLENDACRTMAYLQNPQIIVQKYDDAGTLRAWANDNNIPCITVEIGNPSAFQEQLVDDTLDGVLNTMRHLKMIKGRVKNFIHDTVICEHSYWLYSTKGGIVEVFPNLTDFVKKGQVIARVHDVFGQTKEEVRSDREGYVIGKNIKPNIDAGARLVHIGVNTSTISTLENLQKKLVPLS
ncbi:MAG: succinylglutamate desuccinylase/aspartoacylase family protein [Deltaproteobacteria bacterium]|jgi:uncharacterized protein|nr:MAG: succinylglutamate desuccinylase/aspartoacylase family protein [Deltaproteobacteria bacterium]TNF26200.1 MAG: succinylglutamate desuccinylase/aspartoacylase family protein [Deltaproteobacteria bacterium]